MTRTGWGAAAAAAILFLIGCGSGSGSEEAPAPGASSAKAAVQENGHPLVEPTEDPGVLYFESELTRLVNAHRVSLGLNALADWGDLRNVARGHSRHMIVHEFFNHTSPEGSSPASRLDEAGLPWTLVGENIGAAYGSPESVFAAWLSSPGHRAVMEYEGWTHTGVGYALDGAPAAEFPHAHYWTQMFLKR